MTGFRRAIAGLGCGLLLAGAAVAGEQPGLPYVADPESLEDQSLDLFVPDDAKSPPLLAFVHSRFWDRRDGGRSLATNFARPLARRGVAVAIVRHRLAPDHLHPEPAQDVAAAVAYLQANAGRLGFDPKRFFLGGHASGAHLAALVALDERYLSEAGAPVDTLTGAILFSGLYDLEDTETTTEEERALVSRAFPGEDQRSGASPLRHVRSDAPPFLVLVAGDDIPSAFPGSKALTEALRDAGAPKAEGMLIKHVNHFTILDFRAARSAAREGVLEFIEDPTAD